MCMRHGECAGKRCSVVWVGRRLQKSSCKRRVAHRARGAVVRRKSRFIPSVLYMVDTRSPCVRVLCSTYLAPTLTHPLRSTTNGT